MTHQPTDLLPGTLDLLILKALSLGPRHGLGISGRIEQVTGGTFQVKPGSLFPALHRMREQGWLLSEWGASEHGRRAKYYRITRAGLRQLEAEKERWGRVSIAVAGMHAGRIVVAGCLAFTARAQDRAEPVVIELHNPQSPFAAITVAEATASQLYADIGIRLGFQVGTSHTHAGSIAIDFDTGAPANFHAGALAYAEPYATSGVRIHVFFDRVRLARSDPPMGVLLGYVIAHEVGHILERASQHSAEGIMKACWTHADFKKMAARALSFTREDVESIRSAIARRTSLSTITAR
jgi:PadR family transcriptional regulator, regulatory protein PadR